MKAAAHENLWGGVNERGPTLSCRGVERGIVVIPKSVTASRIAANRDLFGFALDDEVGGTSTCHSLVHSLDLRGVHVSLVHSLSSVTSSRYSYNEGVPAPISAATNGQYIRARQMGLADADFAAVRSTAGRGAFHTVSAS